MELSKLVKGCVKMFEVGERVVYGHHGVCEIVKIDTLDMPNVPKDRQYYYLSPTTDGTSIMYAPVDNPKLSIRRVMTKDDVMSLIKAMPQIDMLNVTNDKQRENEYKECIRSLDGKEWVRLLKTVRERGRGRMEKGKKMTALDERYMKMAEMQLYSEIYAVLEIPRNQVEGFIEEHMVVA